MGFKAGAGDLGSDLKINDGTIKIKEQANAEGDTTAYGQLWVKSNTPNDLYFTNDAGNDVRITNGSSLAAAGSASEVAADDIAAGDGAVSIETTSGNITIDAQANNADVIIKVDDGGSSVTAVTFDGSDEGNAIFVNDLKLSSDASAIHFGADNEITLTHVHNTGLTLEASAASTPVLEIKNTHNGGTAGILKFNNTEGGQDGADGDDLGSITFWGNDDGTPSAQQYAGILAEISDASSGAEGGKLSLQVAEHDGTVTTGLLLQDGNANGEIDVTIGAGTSSITTIAGVLDLGDRNITNVGDVSLDSLSSDGSLVTINAPLEVAQGSSGGGAALLVDNDDTDQIAINIEAANIDADVMQVTADAVTTAFVMDVTADALTSGGILNLVSDSSDTTARTLVKVHNDNTAAVGVQMVHLLNDAIGGDGDPILLIESTAAETHPLMRLQNSNAATDKAATMDFFRSDNSAEANGMDLGKITFSGLDAGNAEHIYVQLLAEAKTVTAGQEGGKLSLMVAEHDGTVTAGLVLEDGDANGEIDVTIGAGTSSITTIAGVLDLGDRNITNVGDVSLDSLSSDGSLVTINAPLEIAQGSSGGAAALVLDNDDTDQIALNIEAANIDADVIQITADAVTTALVMDITADGLTDGGIINAISDASDNSARTLVNIKNDNTAAVGATLLAITNDAVASTAGQTVLIESTAAETKPLLRLKNSNAAVDKPAILDFFRSDTSAEADGMDLGQINFSGMDGGNNETVYAAVLAEVVEVDHGSETGKLSFFVAENDGTNTAGLVLSGVSDTDGEIDVTIGAGTSSVTTVGGVIKLGGNKIQASDGGDTITLDTSDNVTIAGDLTVSGGDVTLAAGSSTIGLGAVAHDTGGPTLTIQAGNATAGTSNNQAGGALTIAGGQGKGTSAGGDIIFKTANAAGGAGSSLNALATALTISDDLSSTFAGAIQANSTVTVGTNDTGYDVKFFGATSGDYLLWDESKDTLQLNGGLAKKAAVKNSGSSYTAAINDYFIIIDTSSGGANQAFTVNLPAANTFLAGQILIIKDFGGDASSNNITIDGNSSETIDGATTKVISTNYGVVRLLCNGANAWFTW